MNTSAPAPAPSTSSPLRVKGRLMLQEEFTERLQTFCTWLGFSKVKIWHSDTVAEHTRSGPIFTPTPSAGDAVILLSCRIDYNPDWGHCGLPHLRVRENNGDRSKHCPPAFIAPFLRQYRFAQEQIFLTETEQGNHLITLPECHLKKDGEECGSRLLIDLSKVAEPDGDGAFVPVMVSGMMSSYVIATNGGSYEVSPRRPPLRRSLCQRR